MTTPCRRPHAGVRPRARKLPLLAALLLALACAPATTAGAKTSPTGTPPDSASAPWRTYSLVGPYRPPIDTEHWVDPRGSVVLAVGFAVPVCPVALLGVEGLSWFASYAAEPASGFLVQAGSRMNGEYAGMGPTCIVRTQYAGWEPWASASLLLVWSHLEWPGSFVGLPGTVALENRWKGTLGFGAGLDRKLWRSGGLGLRYQYVPLETDFGALSKGSANTGVNALMLGVWIDVPTPVGYRRR